MRSYRGRRLSRMTKKLFFCQFLDVFGEDVGFDVYFVPYFGLVEHGVGPGIGNDAECEIGFLCFDDCE